MALIPKPTRKDFIERNMHLVGGLVLDAIRQAVKGGPELSRFYKLAMDEIERMLGKLYDELDDPATPALLIIQPSLPEIEKPKPAASQPQQPRSIM